MIFPNHHEDINHWSFFIIDPESKRVSWVDTYIPTREDAKKGIKKDAWAYSEKTQAILTLLQYIELETENEPFKLETVETVDQRNVIDCGVLVCYLAYAFSQRL